MTRRVLVLDRTTTLLLGAALVAVGLLALDWRYDQVLDLPATLHTAQADDVLATSWWPWAYAAGALVLGLAGLWWLLAHLRRPGPSTQRLRASDPTGRIELDVRSVATAVADRFASLAPVAGARGTTRTVGRRSLVEVRARIAPSADARAIIEATATCAADLAVAFPDDDLTCRVVLDAPRQPRTGRSTPARVR